MYAYSEHLNFAIFIDFVIFLDILSFYAINLDVVCLFTGSLFSILATLNCNIIDQFKLI